LHAGFLGGCLAAGDTHGGRKVCGGVAPSPYEVYKLVLLRGERRPILICPYSITVVGSL